MNTSSQDARDGRNVLAGTFSDRDRAHAAVHRLHEEGFHDTWLGITQASDATQTRTASYDAADAMSEDTSASSGTRVESDNWFMRFLGEGNVTLHDALVRHGVNESDARNAGALAPRSAIVTVNGANHPELAAQVLSESGGTLLSSGFGATGIGTDGRYGSASDVARDDMTDTGMRDSGYRDYGRYRGGQEIDDSRRLQLREERVGIDKERIARGEVTIGKDVISQQHDIDVPLVREELFIERRPVNDGASTTSEPIGVGETIRVPLSEERVNVTKSAVVAEEIVIGKREVSDTQHVSETTRTERLNVSDVTDADAAAEQNLHTSERLT